MTNAGDLVVRNPRWSPEMMSQPAKAHPGIGR